nr:hypothetical protein [Tanacetum cinerariifolium]
VKLQALIDRKKVVITEDTIRQALRLDDANGVECLSNEEIFAKLARMRYEKPPPKLTFYKAFFSAQWKFLIHMIVQCMCVKRTAWNEFSSSMASAVICLATEEDEDDNEVPAAPSPPSHTHKSSPPSQERIPSPPQAQPAPPSSPPQQQPTQTIDTSESSMSLLNTLMETCATLTQKVAHLEQDKVAQALEIVKLKQGVKKLEKKRKSKSSILKRLRKVELDADKDVTLVDVDTAVEMDADTQGRMEEDVTAIKEINASKPTVFDDEDEKEDLEKAKVLQQQYDQKQENMDWNIVAEQMQEKHLDNIKKYQSLKRKPISVAQDRKNMIVYFKNIVGYKIQHFKDRDEEPTKKRAAKETLLQESFKKLRAEVEVSGSSSTQQDTPTVDNTEISEEDV